MLLFYYYRYLRRLTLEVNTFGIRSAQSVGQIVMFSFLVKGLPAQIWTCWKGLKESESRLSKSIVCKYCFSFPLWLFSLLCLKLRECVDISHLQLSWARARCFLFNEGPANVRCFDADSENENVNGFVANSISAMLRKSACVYDVVKMLTYLRYLVSSSSVFTVVNRFNVKQCPCIPTKLRQHQMFNYLFSCIRVILVDAPPFCNIA